MKKFNESDKVYCPIIGTKVFTVRYLDDNATYSVGVENEAFTAQGTIFDSHIAPVVFHATERNRGLLSELYRKEFDPPLLTGSTLARELLKKGKSIMCAISHKSETDALCYDVTFVLIERYDEQRECFCDVNGTHWKYAVPVNQYGELVKDEYL